MCVMWCQMAHQLMEEKHFSERFLLSAEQPDLSASL